MMGDGWYWDYSENIWKYRGLGELQALRERVKHQSVRIDETHIVNKEIRQLMEDAITRAETAEQQLAEFSRTLSNAANKYTDMELQLAAKDERITLLETAAGKIKALFTNKRAAVMTPEERRAYAIAQQSLSPQCEPGPCKKKGEIHNMANTTRHICPNCESPAVFVVSGGNYMECADCDFNWLPLDPTYPAPTESAADRIKRLNEEC